MEHDLASPRLASPRCSIYIHMWYYLPTFPALPQVSV